jgi:hypothetical protein
MSVLSTLNPTLLDLAKAKDPDGSIATVAEILTAQNEILADMSWQEGNMTMGNRSTIRSGLPTATWRKLYGGVKSNKGTLVQVDDSCGMLEAWAEVDRDLANMSGDVRAFRMIEDAAHIEGMNQEMADTLFFGNEAAEPEAFTGFAPRFNSLSAANGQNIIVGGSSGSDNTSIWLVGWSPRTVFGIVPKGSKAGLQQKDYGEVVKQDASDGSNTGNLVVYQTHYKWDAGFVVKDWRYVVRIPNIDKSELAKDASSGADLPDLLFQALRRPPSNYTSTTRPVLYMSRNTQTFLERQLSAKVKESTLKVEQVGGVRTDTYQGIPIRRVDVLAADEALVS